MHNKLNISLISFFLVGAVLILNCPIARALEEIRPIVFMVSGVAGSDFSSLAPYFQENGLDYKFIPGQWGGSIDARVRYTGPEIVKILGDSKRPCAVIGHSYGGVVAREVVRTQLGNRCSLFISSAGAQGSSPWANYVKGLAIQAPGKLPEHLLAIGTDLLFNYQGPKPSSISLNALGAIFILIRGFPKWDEALKNWENDFLAAMNDLETHKIPNAEQVAPDMPSGVEIYSFGLSQKRNLPDLSWPSSILHGAINRLSIMLEQIGTPSAEAMSSEIVNDGIIPTESMKLGPNFFCTEGSHFSGMHNFPYLGTHDVRGQLLKAYSSLAACKLLGTKQACLKWQLIQGTLSPCP